MLAPGLPAPGASWEGATSCGAKRLRVCADASGGMAQTKAAAVITQHQMLVGPHPAMAAFFDSNRGNFKPMPRRLALHHIRYCALAAFIARPIMRDADTPPGAAPCWRLYPGVKRLTTA
jgi:hypothetical protein